MRRTFVMFLPRPKTDAFSGCDSTGTPASLVSVCLRNFFNEQSVDTAICIITRHAREAGINHQPYPINRDARLRDIRGNDDFRLVMTGDGGILISWRKFAVQWQ